MAKATVTAKVEGAGRAGSRIQRGVRMMPADMVEELDHVAGRSVQIMRSVAPSASGRLAREIHPEIVSGGFDLISDVESDEGYSYTGVTRVGHRVQWIEPVRGRALRFELGGRVLLRRRVRGYRPVLDWVDRGLPAVDSEFRRASDRLGGRIIRRLG